MKTEEEKSLRGTTTLYKDKSIGLVIYVRGKKLFMRDMSQTWSPIREVDPIEAAYRIRREYLASQEAGREIAIFAPLKRCKNAAEMSIKLEKMLFPSRKSDRKMIKASASKV